MSLQDLNKSVDDDNNNNEKEDYGRASERVNEIERDRETEKSKLKKIMTKKGNRLTEIGDRQSEDIVAITYKQTQTRCHFHYSI